MSDILQIGLSSLLAYKTALGVVSNNIANVATPFYSRRQIDMASAMFNNGVQVADVNRVYDAYMSRTLLQAQNGFGMSDTIYQQFSQLESYIKDDTNSIGSYLSDTLKSIRELNTDPSLSQNRSLFLNKMSILSNRFNTIDNLIQQQEQSVGTSLDTVTKAINSITSSIADINGQISLLQGADPSGLLDQREALVQKLATYVDFSSQVQPDGQLSILCGNGSPLVFGKTASTISVAPDPMHKNANILSMNVGNTPIDVTRYFHGGQVAGLLSTQSQLMQTQREFDRLAASLMNSFNSQNKLGIDANGNLGGNIFTDINSTSAIANRHIANPANAGTEQMSVSITNPAVLTASEYELRFDTATHYILTRKSDGVAVNSGNASSLPLAINADGFQINIPSGTISAGDTFTITPTAGMAANMRVGITDPNLLAIGWPVTANPSTNNQGQGTITVTGMSDTTTSAFSTPNTLSPPLRIEFLSATQYQIVDASNSTVMEGPLTYTSGAAIFPTPGGYQPGYQLSLSGVMQAGDTFNVSYNNNAVGDNRNGLQFESLFDRATIGGNTFNKEYNSVAGNISLVTNQAKTNADSGQIILTQAKSQYDQISGVSIEEETSNFALYQEAYQASAQILQVAKTVFETIISLGAN